MHADIRRNPLTPLTIAALVGIAVEASGQQVIVPRQGPAEQVGEVVGNALDQTGRALDQTGRAIERGFRSAFARSRDTVESMEVTSRVYSRLHWDRELVGSRLYLETRPGGLVTLRGTVPTRAAAERALALTTSTIGVSRVISELTSPESPSPGVIEASPPSVLDNTPLGPLPSPSVDPIDTLDPLPDPVPAPDVEPPLSPSH